VLGDDLTRSLIPLPSIGERLMFPNQFDPDGFCKALEVIAARADEGAKRIDQIRKRGSGGNFHRVTPEGLLAREASDFYDAYERKGTKAKMEAFIFAVADLAGAKISHDLIKGVRRRRSQQKGTIKI